jgi:hypothetical protein
MKDEWGWHPASDKPEQDYTELLITDKAGYLSIIFIDGFDHQTWEEMVKDDEIDAWSYIPEP